MTTFNFVFLSTPPMPSPLPHMCCACGKAPATGVISYAGKVHEPHCEECCKAWEEQMRFCSEERYVAELAFFRAWQEQMRVA